MSHSIDDLRDRLFKAMDRLNDPDKPMDIEHAKVTAELAQVIINSAKVEVEHAKVTGKKQSTFLGAGETAPQLPAPADTTVQQIAGGRRITHKCR